MNARLTQQYLLVLGLLGGFVIGLVLLIQNPPFKATSDDSLWVIWPLLWLIGLTGLVWVLMAIFRNYAVIRGAAKLQYFRSYASQAPEEWVERPARAFKNLLELPLLFYLLCLLILQTGSLDSVQLSLAWLFVGLRYAHSLWHITVNYVPVRFALYAMGFLTLSIMWVRFATQLFTLIQP